MGIRVDIFVIKNKEIEVRYSHWGAGSPQEMLSAVATHLEEYKVVDGPMADCFCELAIIADFDQRKLSWAHDDSSDMFKRTVPGWRVEQLSCYCAIVFELTKAGLWKWDAAKRSACTLLEEDDQMDAVDAL